MSARRLHLRVLIRQRLTAIARAQGLPDGAAPTERQFLESQRRIRRTERVSVYQVLKQGGALERGGWTDAVRAFGLRPLSTLTRPRDIDLINDLVRVANLTEDPRACPSPGFYRAHGRFNYATVLRITPEHDRSWHRVAIEAGLEPRSARYGSLDREQALRDLRRFARRHGYEIGSAGPPARVWDRDGPYPASRLRQPHLFGTWSAFLQAGGFAGRDEPAGPAEWRSAQVRDAA